MLTCSYRFARYNIICWLKLTLKMQVSKSDMELVSVIITTKNSAVTLKKLLVSIAKQTYKQKEIIVVDNQSADGTKQIAHLFTHKVYDKGPERSAQRNFGASKALGKYLLFLDSDMVLTENVLKECLEKFKESKDELGGVVMPEKSFGQGIWARAKVLERKINMGEPYFESARFISRDIFLKFKGFDEEITGPEDWDLPQRIAKKYKTERIQSFILHNEGRLKLSTLYKKKFYYGLSAHKYLKKQNLPIIGPTTVYFLRPAFYKNWSLLLKKPYLSSVMIIMLSVELFGGGLGYIIGRLRG